MRKLYLSLLLVAVFCNLVIIPSAESAWVWSPTEGRFVSPDSIVTKSADELFTEGTKLRETGEKDKAIKIFQSIVKAYPNSAFAPESQFVVASLYEEKGDFRRSVKEFQKLVKEFSQSNRAEEAIEHLFKIGNLLLSGQKQKFMGVVILPSTSKAIEIFQFIAESAPYGKLGDQVQFNLGLAYRKAKNYSEAVQAFQTLIENYPSSPLVDDAHYQLAEASYEFARSADRDQRPLQEAQANLDQFLKQYGSSNMGEKAQSLKKALDEQEAGKSYRIGLYYEKTGFMDSARIYYEDIARNFEGTEFGQKSKERLEKLKEPAVVAGKDKEAIERRLAEINSILEAVRREKKATPEVEQQKKQLESEKQELLRALKRFEDEKTSDFKARFKALRQREKNLHTKFKIYEKKKKLLNDNSSPELKEAFDKWHQSLIKEQEELAKERERLNAYGLEIRKKERSWWGWVSVFNFKKVPSIDRLLSYPDKKINEYRKRKEMLDARKQQLENDLASINQSIEASEQKEFDVIKEKDWFKAMWSDEIMGGNSRLEDSKRNWDQSLESFEKSKAKYINQYGKDAYDQLGIKDNVYSQGEFIAGGSDLEGELNRLREQKAALTESWLTQKEKVKTISKAFNDETQKVIAEAETVSEEPVSESDQVNALEIRILKKRMKYLEREIRKRLDQIQDWQRENADRMDRLDHLMHPKKLFATPTSKTGGVITFPIVGFYKLTKAFIFGLPNRDQQLAQEVRQKIAEAPSELGEHADEIRKLKEEIELQSILIQGRANEVKALERSLNDLKKQSKKYPNFNFRSLLVERLSYELNHSVEEAKLLLPDKDAQALLISRLDLETQELKRLEQQLAITDGKMKIISRVIRRSKKKSLVNKTRTITPEDAAAIQKKAEAQLKSLKVAAERFEQNYLEEKKGFEKSLFDWYRAQIEKGFVPKSEDPALQSVVSERQSKLGEKTKTAGELKRTTAELVEVDEKLLDQLVRQIAVYQKRLNRIEDRSVVHEEALTSAIEKIGAERDDLRQEIKTNQELLKSGA